jgi:hypothetical protein
MTDRIPTSHAQHDPFLVAALAAGDLEGADRELAETLASACAGCALLAADLRAIATASAALPARTRPRDFFIRAEDAARLRRRSWRGLLAAFVGPRSGALRPLAAGLTTLGIAGLLLGVMPSLPLGGSAAAPAGSAGASAEVPKTVDTASGAEPTRDPGKDGNQYSAAPQPALVPVSGPAGPSVEIDRLDGEGRDAAEPAASGQPGATAPAARAASPLVVLSGAFLILGLGLFGLRWTARRLGDG